MRDGGASICSSTYEHLGSGANFWLHWSSTERMWHTWELLLDIVWSHPKHRVFLLRIWCDRWCWRMALRRSTRASNHGCHIETIQLDEQHCFKMMKFEPHGWSEGLSCEGAKSHGLTSSQTKAPWTPSASSNFAKTWHVVRDFVSLHYKCQLRNVIKAPWILCRFSQNSAHRYPKHRPIVMIS